MQHVRIERRIASETLVQVVGNLGVVARELVDEFEDHAPTETLNALDMALSAQMRGVLRLGLRASI